MFFPFLLRQVRFHAFCQFAAGEHDTMLAAFAFQTDICAEPHHGPFIRAAGMWFAQTQVIVHLQVWKHTKDYTFTTIDDRP